MKSLFDELGKEIQRSALTHGNSEYHNFIFAIVIMSGPNNLRKGN
jgi:hypothetical protein